MSRVLKGSMVYDALKANGYNGKGQFYSGFCCIGKYAEVLEEHDVDAYSRIFYAATDKGLVIRKVVFHDRGTVSYQTNTTEEIVPLSRLNKLYIEEGDRYPGCYGFRKYSLKELGLEPREKRPRKTKFSVKGSTSKGEAKIEIR